VSYKTNRASRDAHQRDKIVSKIQKRLGVEGDTQKLITNQGVKKYTQSGESRTVLAQAKIDNDAMWDGLHGVITNIKPKKNKAEKAELAVIDTKDEGEDAVAVISRYSRLWKIEESFRINKHTLSMRPIFHFKPERIKAHIAICYMAFSVLRNMEYKVKLTQKISPERMIDELVNVQASLYRHTPTNRLYRMPGAFSNDAAKIYKTFHIKRKNNAQEIILEQK
jgi:transposase